MRECSPVGDHGRKLMVWLEKRRKFVVNDCFEPITKEIMVEKNREKSYSDFVVSVLF